MLSVCPHDCPSCCSLVVTVEAGRLTSVTGNAEHPFTRGVICGKVREYAERVHSPLRVLTPLRRVGPKGAGDFAPISWDEAIDTIAARWRAIIASEGGETILPFSYAGSMGQVQFFAGHPLFHALGASRLERSICTSTAYAGWRATVGAVTGNDSEQMVGAELVILWGVNASYSTINVMTLVKETRARGAYVVAIDPYRTPTAQQADEHLMVRPGTDADADAHGGALLSTGGAYGFDYSVLERPDLMPTPAPRTVNMIQLGRALTDRAMSPPVRALYVYSSNPAAVCPNQTLVLEGLAREDLFTVVHEQVMTDTAHYADLVLPATTSMEHLDLYRSFGQLTLQLAKPVLPPQGEAKSNWEAFGLLARAMGVAQSHYAKGDEGLIREFLAKGDASVRSITWEQLARDGWARVALPSPYRPFADGAPTPSGKVEFYSASLERHGLPALPTYVPLAEGHERRELTARFPLQCIVPPNRFFLNSSFSQSARLRRRQGTATAMLAPIDAAARGIGEGDTVLVESARGSARFAARITDGTRPGVVVIEGIWWHRFHPGGRGVNVLTSDRVADLGGGPAFHSNLVQVHKA